MKRSLCVHFVRDEVFTLYEGGDDRVSISATIK